MEKKSKKAESPTATHQTENEMNSNPSRTVQHEIEADFRQLFRALDTEQKGSITLHQLFRRLQEMGIKKDDFRLRGVLGSYLDRDDEDLDETILEFADFLKIMQGGDGASLIQSAIRGDLIVPEFKQFSREIREICEAVKQLREGSVATYIPQLGRVNPDLFAVTICTIDGQQFHWGDYRQFFSVQSVCKPINYCITLEEHGEEKVHRHIGREPSGIGFNGLVLNDKGLPHNPMINAGAIMACSLIKPHFQMADRFDYVLDVWSKLAGNSPARFNNAVYLSERETADRNFALGYFMREKKAFPENTDLNQTLEFYFQCCSIEINSEQLAVTAATLANAGVCPTTGERIFRPDTVKNCLSLMSSCGMYDFSGEFAFTIGLPAKSGVSGDLMIVVPNLMGIAIYSPALDQLGNSVRGIEFCKQLIKNFNFHNFDSLTGSLNQKKDPRVNRAQTKIDGVISLCWAASEGDLFQVQSLVARGVDVDAADYDGRTAIHLAASEGHPKVVRYLLNQRAQASPKDRWGNTPLSDAIRGKHEEVIRILEEYNATT
ncbi:MAG: glutaminase A [Saprospiraceae bacterium]|nr:glutaminase A [Saprospiraceae bacterium]